MIKNMIKSKTFIIIAAAVLIAAIGFTAGMMARTSMAESNSSDYIGADRAKQIALESVGVTDKNATFTKVEIDQDDSVPHYDLEFYTASVEYEFEIEALTGNISHKESKNLMPQNNLIAAPSQETLQNQTNQQTQVQQRARIHHDDDDDVMHSEGNHNVHDYIGVSQAKHIALQHAGVSAEHAAFTCAELDSDDGVRVYEIDFTCNGIEYEYDINAKTGTVLSHESEPLDSDD